MALGLNQPVTEMSSKGLDSWPLKISLTLWPHYGPGVELARNRNKYQRIGFLTPEDWLNPLATLWPWG